MAERTDSIALILKSLLGTLSAHDLVDGTTKIKRISRRHQNLILEAADGRGIFIKGASPAPDDLGLGNELAFYQAMVGLPIIKWMPTLIASGPANCAVVTELLQGT